MVKDIGYVTVVFEKENGVVSKLTKLVFGIAYLNPFKVGVVLNESGESLSNEKEK